MRVFKKAVFCLSSDSDLMKHSQKKLFKSYYTTYNKITTIKIIYTKKIGLFILLSANKTTPV